MSAASVLVDIALLCVCTQALSPPGPPMKDVEMKDAFATAQGSLRRTLAELEGAADTAIVSAREVLESAASQANDTVMASQAPLMDLLESVTSTISNAVSSAREFGTNITSCVSGQEEAARAIVKGTGGTIVSCVTDEIKKAVNLATNMFSVASTAKNLLSYAPKEFRGCLPSLIPTIDELVKIPSCIGSEISAFSAQATKIASALASYLNEGGRLVETLGSELRRCSSSQIEAGTQDIRRIEKSVVSCVRQKLSAVVAP